MSHSQNQGLASGGDDEDDGYEDQVADTDTHAGGGSDAWRFLLAGGIAGAGMSFLNVLCCSIGVQGVKCHARVQERKRIKGLCRRQIFVAGGGEDQVHEAAKGA